MFQKTHALVVRHGLRIMVLLTCLVGVGLAVSNALSTTATKKSPAASLTILPAVIRPVRSITVSAAFPGRVDLVAAKAGANVKAGDLLMHLSNNEYELEYQRARTHFENVQHRVGALVAGNLSANVSDLDAHTAQSSMRAAETRLAAFSMDETERAYDTAVKKMRSIDRLAQGHLASEAEVEESHKLAAAYQRELRAEREHFSRLVEEKDLAQSRYLLLRRRTPGGRSETVNLDAELRDAALSMEVAEKRRAAQDIVATTDGRLLKTMVNAGDQIPSGIPLAQIAHVDQLDVAVPVGASLARSIQPGHKVRVLLPTEPPQNIDAAVSSVDLAPAQEGSAYTVHVLAQNPDHSTLLIGLAAGVEFRHSEDTWHKRQY